MQALLYQLRHTALHDINASETLSINAHIYFRLNYRVISQVLIKAFPCVAFPLTIPIHPEEQNLYYPLPEVVQHLIVVSNTIIVIVSCQNLVYLFDDILFLLETHVPYGHIHLFAFLPIFLTRSFVLHSEFSISAFRAVVCKSKKFKRFCISFTSSNLDISPISASIPESVFSPIPDISRMLPAYGIS